MLTSEQFDRTRRLALSLAGIALVERHRELLARRSRRLGIHDHAGLDLLLNAAEAGEAGARQRLLGLLTTKFTGFFRHPRHFDQAAKHAQEAVRKRGRARLWSAGAATGEEPYSLAMALIEVFQSDGPPAGILATDIDAAALARGERGEYAESALRELAPARRAAFFTATTADRWQLVPAVRRLVAFRTLNLVDDAAWNAESPFDVVFCRNVLMYLESSHRYAVLERLASLLAPEGLLVLDPTEHLGEVAHLFTAGTDGVYSLRPSSDAPERPMFSATQDPALGQAAVTVEGL